MKEISKEKAAAALKQEELGVPLEDIIRDMGVSRKTYLEWRRSYRGGDAGTPADEQSPDRDTQIPRTPKDD